MQKFKGILVQQGNRSNFIPVDKERNRINNEKIQYGNPVHEEVVRELKNGKRLRSVIIFEPGDIIDDKKVIEVDDLGFVTWQHEPAKETKAGTIRKYTCSTDNFKRYIPSTVKTFKKELNQKKS